MASWDLSEVQNGQIIDASHVREASNDWQGDVDANASILQNLNYLGLNEIAVPATPAAGKALVFVDTADGLAKIKKDTGAVVSLEGGSEDAVDVSFTPFGDIAATNVQSAIEELDTEKSATGHTHTAGDLPNLESLNGTLDIGSGGTGQVTATAAFDALGPLTLKGDVIVFDGSNHVRLGAGIDGQVLKANSTTTEGVEWATETGGGGNATFVDNEVPSGAIDGVNTTFTLANIPAANSLDLFLDSVRLVEGTHFTLTNDTIEMTDAPLTGQSFLANYRKTSLAGFVTETPSGTIDGVNDTFTLSFIVNPPESLNLYLDSARLVEGTHFTLSNDTITFVDPPLTGQTLVAVYRLLGPSGVDAASELSFSPAGNIAATDVQAAIEELDTEKAAASHSHTAGDLPNLESLNGTLDIGSGGTGAVTATAAFDALGPLTTKGDLVVFDGSNHIRIPAGTDGQVLQANSGVTEGIEWIDFSGVTVYKPMAVVTQTKDLSVAGNVTVINVNEAGKLSAISLREISGVTGSPDFDLGIAIDGQAEEVIPLYEAASTKSNEWQTLGDLWPFGTEYETNLTIRIIETATGSAGQIEVAVLRGQKV